MGQILVRNLFMSVDPYMRGRMSDAPSYVPPFRLGEPLEGGAIGEVVQSRDPGYQIGDVVLHGQEGKITFEEIVVDGLEHAPEAFISMMRGKNVGKMIVRL